MWEMTFALGIKPTPKYSFNENSIITKSNIIVFRWGPWGDLSPCSATCGPAVRTQVRQCFNIKNVVVNNSFCANLTGYSGSVRNFDCENPDCPKLARDQFYKLLQQQLPSKNCTKCLCLMTDTY